MEFQSEKFGFQEPSPHFFGDAFISKICIWETCFPKFAGGLYLKSLHSRNLFLFIFVWEKISQVSIPGTFPLNFLWEKNLTSYHSKNLLPKFLWEKNLTSFHSKNLLPHFFVGKKSHKLPFQEPSP